MFDYKLLGQRWGIQILNVVTFVTAQKFSFNNFLNLSFALRRFDLCVPILIESFSTISSCVYPSSTWRLNTA